VQNLGLPVPGPDILHFNHSAIHLKPASFASLSRQALPFLATAPHQSALPSRS
jgi:hypothetical protein